jgi:hypothetical protein
VTLLRGAGGARSRATPVEAKLPAIMRALPKVALAVLLAAPLAAGDVARAAGATSVVALDPRAFKPVEGPTSGPAVYYQAVEEDGVGMLRGTYRPGMESVVMGVEVPEELRDRARRLKWRWRARAFPTEGNECRSGYGDSAASVLVTFKRGLKWYVLKYVWSTAAPLGAVCDPKRSLLLARDTIVLESGGRPGTWLTEVVDVRRAFIDHFARGDPGADVPDLVGVGVMTDGDQARSESGADWADFQISY